MAWKESEVVRCNRLNWGYYGINGILYISLSLIWMMLHVMTQALVVHTGQYILVNNVGYGSISIPFRISPFKACPLRTRWMHLVESTHTFQNPWDNGCDDDTMAMDPMMLRQLCTTMPSMLMRQWLRTALAPNCNVWPGRRMQAIKRRALGVNWLNA